MIHEIKVIDLLNRIANDEYVPKLIRYNNFSGYYDLFIYDKETKDFTNGKGDVLHVANAHLNDTITYYGEEE